MTGLFLAVIMVFMGPAAEYLSDSYVFQWRRQTFAGDLVFVAPIALSIVVAHFAPSLVVVAGVTVRSGWLSYATLNVNYALFAACLTGYIVFLLSLARMPGVEIAHRRAFCTAMGGAIALAVRLVVLFRRGSGTDGGRRSGTSEAGKQIT